MTDYDMIEYLKRDAFFRVTEIQGIVFYVDVRIKKHPTKLDFLKAYLTLTIPAAMLARVTRFITGRKGTPLENFCMKHYYDQSVKLLAKDSK